MAVRGVERVDVGGPRRRGGLQACWSRARSGRRGVSARYCGSIGLGGAPVVVEALGIGGEDQSSVVAVAIGNVALSVPRFQLA